MIQVEVMAPALASASGCNWAVALQLDCIVARCWHAEPVANANELAKVLSSSGRNGGRYLSRADGNIHAPAGFSTLLVLRTLGDLGATVQSYPEIESAVEFVLASYEEARADPRSRSAHSHLASSIGEDGVVIESPNRSWQDFDFARGGETSQLATKIWRDTQRHLES